MITRTLSRWLMSVALATLALTVINLLLTTSPVQGRPAAALINCAGSIQTCIDAANDGDTILIAAGRYTESLTLSKPVSLTGENRDTTIIHAIAGQRVLTVTGATISNSVVISGLTFTGGSALDGPECPQICGGGIALLNAAQPRISEVRIQYNQAGYGGGIFVDPDSQLIIDNSQLLANIGNRGGGINVGEWSASKLLIISNTSLLSNTAVDGGGIFANGSIILTRTHFVGNTAEGLGGGLYAHNGGFITATNSTFISNTGTAFYTYDSPATIIDSLFAHNSGDIGGGLWAHYVAATISHTDFISNVAITAGGGLMMINGSISDSRIESNAATGQGGGLYAMGTTFVTNTKFVSNTAQSDGGGAYFGDAEIYDSRFEGNIAGSGGGLLTFGLLLSNTIVINNQSNVTNGSWGKGGGGALVVYGDAVVMNSRFENNTTTGNGSGGGLNVDGALTITDSVFVSNTAFQSGGGVSASIADIVNSRFEGNTAGFDTGGLLAKDVVTLTNVDFISNTGGAVLGGPSTVIGGYFIGNQGGGLGTDRDTTISGTVFISNSADIGGGLYANYTATLYNARFEGNTATTYGGGMFAEHIDILSGVEFINNTATTGGGAAIGEIQSISNTSFLDNVATQDGGGLWAGGRFASIANSLFARNSAGATGAAMRLSAGEHVTIIHTTIASPTLVPVAAVSLENWINGHVNIVDTIIDSHTIAISNTGGTVDEDYNLFFGNITNTLGVKSGGHSLVGDPKFIDPLNGDYHLQFGSAAIDRGVEAGVYIDLDGNSRPRGAGFDIGAYEYQSGHYLWLPLIRK
jgi:predicted outer membrane repeat protein